MGLHHLPQQQLAEFIKVISRILRPNGLFLFREHHAHEQLKPLLDVAHMVFNVVTGVDYETEIQEIRAFRTIEQWRSLLRENGFVDTFVYDEQEDDPTDDIMMVFRKVDTRKSIETNDKHEIIRNEQFNRIDAIPESNYFRPCEWLVVRIVTQFSLFLNHTPFFFFPYMKYLGIYWSMLRTETSASFDRYGMKSMFALDSGFTMNFIVGIFLTIAFIQLSLISFLIRFLGGARTQPEYEQLIVEKVDNEQIDFKESIDSRIVDVEQIGQTNIYALRVPRHVAFNAIIRKLAFHSRSFHLLSISNQNEKIQLELSIPSNNPERLLWLKQRANIEIIFEYQHPIDRNQTIIFIRVDIKQLFAFLHDCAPFENNQSLTIVQIFDYYD